MLRRCRDVVLVPRRSFCIAFPPFRLRSMCSRVFAHRQLADDYACDDCVSKFAVVHGCRVGRVFVPAVGSSARKLGKPDDGCSRIIIIDLYSRAVQSVR